MYSFHQSRAFRLVYSVCQSRAFCLAFAMYGVVFSVYYLLASTHTTVHVLSGLLLLADGIVFGTLAYSREGKRLQK